MHSPKVCPALGRSAKLPPPLKGLNSLLPQPKAFLVRGDDVERSPAPFPPRTPLSPLATPAPAASRQCMALVFALVLGDDDALLMRGQVLIWHLPDAKKVVIWCLSMIN
ncbi:uncharacterized protein PHACADRAFT_206365 [Phanerochaete carnosa HHB-10118-sp]|uniref:Uncharacterized protein n=1 Tax=Phanerochaete carnosa (strain HHB-10118-sp) TaxID=650164 RepID=K5W0V2_PHACS|nr:uncharacterized protein PHACADRAFT_206365 [Phanerochaete carnosa HHB-10118-sp]EKM57453.1 hypothetical protein PHACADRAFT_206365 [Phanerochaete carnosa HHB-10118-sp]